MARAHEPAAGNRATLLPMGVFKAVGARGRVAIVLGACAGTAMLLLAVGSEPLLIPRLAAQRGERLAWAASAAAAGAPADASAWEAWVERVRSTLPDA
ncbi:MAG: hypothetical protein FJ087_06205, partial [Deltaproteobacteria bacterium]|nr:hypothetical protein [Deltaproteobacteria bacterium]